MKYVIQDHTVQDLKIAYIGGGSRGWARTFMTDLALEDKLSGEIRLYDLDRKAAEQNEKIGNDLSARPDVVGKWYYRTTDTLKEALIGCDFVIISILPGTFDEMEVDVHMPERIGVYQSVGDTAGPGGVIRALRTLPMFAEIGKAIREFAPDAWVINFTNPMTLCVRTLYEVYPQIKAFGCCHEVFGTQETLMKILEETRGITGIKRSDVHVNVIGINHFTWFTEASCHGIDLFPVFEEYVEQHFEEGFVDQSNHWLNTYFGCAHRVKFDLFRRFGAIAAAGDRHLAEFMPGDQYLLDEQTANSWRFTLTPVSWRKQDLAERLEKSHKLYQGEEKLELKPTGEEAILLMKAICGLGRVISNVNIPNTVLQIPNLPANEVVETNAVFDRDSIRPVCAGPIPDKIRKLIMPHVQIHEKTLKAALNPDFNLVVDAFMEDPNMKGKSVTRDQAEILARDMIRATLTYLPKEWTKQIEKRM